MASAKHLVLFHHEPANNDATPRRAAEGGRAASRSSPAATRRSRSRPHTTDWRSISEHIEGACGFLALVLLAAVHALPAGRTADHQTHCVTPSSTVTSGSSRSSATADPVVMVLIDEHSLATYGQWPWPRTRVAELIRAISERKPRLHRARHVFPGTGPLLARPRSPTRCRSSRRDW